MTGLGVGWTGTSGRMPRRSVGRLTGRVVRWHVGVNLTPGLGTPALGAGGRPGGPAALRALRVVAGRGVLQRLAPAPEVGVVGVPLRGLAPPGLLDEGVGAPPLRGDAQVHSPERDAGFGLGAVVAGQRPPSLVVAVRTLVAVRAGALLAEPPAVSRDKGSLRPLISSGPQSCSRNTFGNIYDCAPKPVCWSLEILYRKKHFLPEIIEK